MERYFIYLEVLKMFNREENKDLKKELAQDLEMLRQGYIPVKYIKR